MVHLEHVMKDVAKDVPPQPQDTSHPAGSHHPLGLDVQAQPVFTFSCEIYSLCD